MDIEKRGRQSWSFDRLTLGNEINCPGLIAFLNGNTGDLLQLTSTADHRELAVGPILKGSGDGETLIAYATGSRAESYGSFFVGSLNDLKLGQEEMVRTLMSNVSRITGIAVSDINKDGMEDFVCE